MKMIAQGLFGKLPVSDEYVMTGIPGWAIDRAWMVQDRLGHEVGRFAVACVAERAVLYGLTWTSSDRLGRAAPCTMMAVEQGREGPPSDPFAHPWFDDACRRQPLVPELCWSEVVIVAGHWAASLCLRRQERLAWPKGDDLVACDGSAWTTLPASLSQQSMAAAAAVVR